MNWDNLSSRYGDSKENIVERLFIQFEKLRLLKSRENRNQPHYRLDDYEPSMFTVSFVYRGLRKLETVKLLIV